MGFLHSLAVRLSLSALLFASLSGAAFGVSPHERTQFGHDISVGANEEVAEVTCFGCNVRVRGKVQGDATVFGGSILVEDQGQVGGDTTSFGGDIRLDRFQNWWGRDRLCGPPSPRSGRDGRRRRHGFQRFPVARPGFWFAIGVAGRIHRPDFLAHLAPDSSSDAGDGVDTNTLPTPRPKRLTHPHGHVASPGAVITQIGEA